MKKIFPTKSKLKNETIFSFACGCPCNCVCSCGCTNSYQQQMEGSDSSHGSDYSSRYGGGSYEVSRN